MLSRGRRMLRVTWLMVGMSQATTTTLSVMWFLCCSKMLCEARIACFLNPTTCRQQNAT